MGILTGLLLLPVAPLRGTIWLAEQLMAIAEEELNDERAIRRLLVEAELALESGELTPAEHERVEDELLARLDALRAAHTETPG